LTVVRRGQAQRRELDALWQEANTYWQQAQSNTDPASTRVQLNEAAERLDELLERRPENTEAAELRQRIETRLDEINGVQRVNWIGTLNTYPSDANLSRVVVEGIHVFVMDRQNSHVYHHQLDELQQALQANTEENVLVSRGQQVGNVLVSNLIDMVWMPVGNGRQKANLIILESGYSPLEYDPTTGELVSLELAATEVWRLPELVGSYFGRFYVLDTGANSIWRYSPTPDGYSTTPDAWLQEEVDLAGVVDMAIGDSIYLLYADGTIRKFTGGQADTFDISDWDMPPRNPSAIFTRPPEDTESVYVADRGNNRIVQCSKEGLFERQFRLADTATDGAGDPLGSTTALFVDEITDHAYFASGDSLYLIILPEESVQ
jgi:hypothetical protein